jgi:hypothetical protein
MPLPTANSEQRGGKEREREKMRTRREKDEREREREREIERKSILKQEHYHKWLGLNLLFTHA